ncbi:MAG TPA: nickel-dependent lactate racemase, partial [Syntrophomonas sp.]|nr:nickel-dependent lactate racemase [Syntrophomonas sp.]
IRERLRYNERINVKRQVEQMIELAYGRGHLQLQLDENNLDAVLEPVHNHSTGGGKEVVEESLAHPIDSPVLEDIITRKKARNAVIVVNDITRPTPYELILPPLLKQINDGGITDENITLVIATGIHRAHTAEDNLAVFGAEICKRYRIENHDCDNNLKSLGYLSNGMELIINRTVAEADLLVTTGVVGLHYFAGYSGGRKSILPGVAARAAIEANHKMMNDPRACLGNYEDNPVSQLMLEAARRVGVDFIVNVVLYSHHEIAFCASGDMETAWLEAVQFAEGMSVLRIDEPADIVVASCGGYPKDINMYQAQKAMDAAVLAVKPGGTIILAAECSEGLGEDKFAEWIDAASCPQDITVRFHRQFELGGHKAFAICRILDRADILLLSGLSDQQVRRLFLQPVHSLDEALIWAFERHGRQARVIVMPEAPKIAVKINKHE